MSDGVNLGYLTWRAVIPYYRILIVSNSRCEAIKKLNEIVIIPIDIKNKWFSDVISRAEDIIDFYEELIIGGRDRKSACVLRNDKYVSVCDLLESGKFTLHVDDVFLMHHLWNDDVFMTL